MNVHTVSLFLADDDEYPVDLTTAHHARVKLGPINIFGTAEQLRSLAAAATAAATMHASQATEATPVPFSPGAPGPVELTPPARARFAPGDKVRWYPPSLNGNPKGGVLTVATANWNAPGDGDEGYWSYTFTEHSPTLGESVLGFAAPTRDGDDLADLPSSDDWLVR